MLSGVGILFSFLRILRLIGVDPEFLNILESLEKWTALAVLAPISLELVLRTGAGTLHTLKVGVPGRARKENVNV